MRPRYKPDPHPWFSRQGRHPWHPASRPLQRPLPQDYHFLIGGCSHQHEHGQGRLAPPGFSYILRGQEKYQSTSAQYLRKGHRGPGAGLGPAPRPALGLSQLADVVPSLILQSHSHHGTSACLTRCFCLSLSQTQLGKASLPLSFKENFW